MAASAAERSFGKQLARLLEPRPGRLEHAGRLALICALTTLVVAMYETPFPALTVYVVFFMNRSDRVESLILNIAMMLLIAIVITVVLLVAMLVLDEPMWRVASMALISFGLLFLASASKLRPIAGIVALVVAYALDVLGKAQVGELATRGLLYTWLCFGISGAVSILVNLLVAPSPRRLAERSIAERLELAAAMLLEADDRVREQFAESSREGVGEVFKWLRLADVERTSPRSDIAALRQAAGSTVVLLSAVELMDRMPGARFPDSLRKSLAGELRQVASILMMGGHPIDITWDSESGVALPPLAEQVRANVERALARFTAPPFSEATAHEAPMAAGGFFAEDAFSNPGHVQYALKTTAAAMACYFLYSQLAWPSIHTCLITCYIVSLGTAAETVEKLTLRIAGCLVGAAAGIATLVFLIPSLTSIGALMTLVFFGSLAAAWVAVGSPRISYAGFQIAFAFLLCVVQGGSPSFDMVTARDRIIGILLGNTVVYLLFTNVWPVSVGGRIDRAIALLLGRLGALLNAASAPARRAIASEAQATLGAIETDLDLIHYEPRSIRPRDAWLAARRDVVHRIAALGAPLLLAADQPGTSLVSFSHRLERLAAHFTASDVIADDTTREGSHTPFSRLLDSHLEALERALPQALDEPA